MNWIELAQRDYGLPNPKTLVGKIFCFSYKKKNSFILITSTITNAELIYWENVDPSVDPQFVLSLEVDWIKEPISVSAFAGKAENSTENIVHWMLYTFKSTEDYYKDNNDDAFEGEFEIID